VNAIAAAAAAPEEATAVPAKQASTTHVVGAASFSDLVRAHFQREQERLDHGAASRETETDFHRKLEQFEREEGKLAAVYWSTRTASAVAMTIGKPRAARNPIAETEMEIRLHRVTDWLTKEQTLIANVLHDCDLLAIRAGEILRGTSERIAMRWIFSVQEHVLGYIEREDAPTPEREREFATTQRHELSRIEEYYFRAAAKAGRIVYVSGMLAGALAIAATTTIVAMLLEHLSSHWNREIEVLLLCTAAGAVGALVSVLSRMSGGSDKFSVDFEVGRPLLRRLGLYKPLVGSVFGVALYFMLASGLLMTKPPTGHAIYFYGAIAFLAGFSERFTGVIFGDVQRLVTGANDPTSPGHAAPPTEHAPAAQP
jgi:hypothetical protein